MYLQKPFQVTCIWHFRIVEPQITRALFQRSILRQIAQAGDIQVVAHLAQHLKVPLRSHLIIYNACNAEIAPLPEGGCRRLRGGRLEMNEARQQGCRRVSRTLRIDHQHDGDIQHSGYLIRGTLVAIISVVEPHHPFHDANIGIFTIMPEEFADVLWGCHKCIEVDAGSAADCLVELRVDIVRAALEGLYLIAFFGEQCHQPSGNRCLARAARRSRYEECLSCCHHHVFCCKIKKNPLIMHHISKKVVPLHTEKWQSGG